MCVCRSVSLCRGVGECVKLYLYVCVCVFYNTTEGAGRKVMICALLISPHYLSLTMRDISKMLRITLQADHFEDIFE